MMNAILVLSITQFVLILQRIWLVGKRIYFMLMIKEKSNPIDTGGVALGFIWEIIIVASRIIIVAYSILMLVYSKTEQFFTF